MPYTIRKNGKRCANTRHQRHMTQPINVSVMVCDLLHEIGFNDPTPEFGCWIHRQDEALKAYWISEEKHLYFEYKEHTDMIFIDKKLIVAHIVIEVLEFVREVYEKGSRG